MAFNIYTFEECLQKTSKIKGKKHLLMGNGFSMAYDSDIFNYKSLYEQSKPKLDEILLKTFEVFETHDFETIIKNLTVSYKTSILYDSSNTKYIDQLQKDIDILKEQLITVLSENHPENPNSIDPRKMNSCIKFLNNFDTLYTLNYDLLLYWVNMRRLEIDNRIKLDDGFRKNTENESSVFWDITNDHKQNIHYLHGALYIFDNGHEYEKVTWVNTDKALKTQITEKIQNNTFPLIVTEGTKEEKQSKIHTSAYLSRGLKSINGIGGTLFIYGHSLAENDFHIFEKISYKLTYIFISIYGEHDSEENLKIFQRAETIKEKFKISAEINFYQAESAKVWNIS